ncbi:CcdC protein domain-containing protein [Streptomyces sp. AC512_CC834]|uniref:CcdC protein domain-containing protein n=1 Tax=Streptomyces sp. AC512_CC834 TaxID=2823691 RepID=UPI001C27048A|nr:CcdC protein domain-containing protein [Streptomyces sp. AC512_CC834]
MSGLVDVLVITAVAGLVITRQFRASRIDTDRRWWVLPVVLGIVALREPGIIDAHHHTASVLLLAAGILVGLVTGAGWARTTRIWVEADGAVWSRGSRASVAVWVAGIVLRAGLFGVGAALGVRQDSSALLVALAATLLVRSGVLAWRVQGTRPAGMPGPAYGDAVSRPTRKEPA